MQVDLEKHLGSFTLAARFELPGAGTTALFGPSGSGKTSLVNLIAGISRPERGLIRVGDTTLFDSASGIDLPIEARAIGYVFQDARLLPHLSVEHNLGYGARRAARHGRSPTLGLSDVVSVLGIGALLQRRPHHLSTGERQRVAIGRALLSQPRLLLMDEPLASLDSARKLELLPYIERLRDDFRIPIVYVSHALDEIVRLADHLVVLAGGRTVASGSLFDVMGDAGNAVYLGALDAGAVIACRVDEHSPAVSLTTLSFAGGTLRVPALSAPVGTRVRVRLRAHDVALARSREPGLSITNQIEGRIQQFVERPGPYVEVVFAAGDTLLRSLITRESRARMELVVGMQVWGLVRSVALDGRSVAAEARADSDSWS